MGVPELPSRLFVCHQNPYLGAPGVGQVALFNVFLLSICQGCGLAESWTVGRRGWHVFPFAIGDRRPTSCAQAAGASSLWRSHVVYAVLSGIQGSGDVMLSVPGVFQIPFSFLGYLRRGATSPVSAQSAWVLA